jgi:hypothetical protein
MKRASNHLALTSASRLIASIAVKLSSSKKDADKIKRQVGFMRIGVINIVMWSMVVITFTLINFSASATIINLGPNNFGHLSQLDPGLVKANVCSANGLTACGPVAAVNSFSYLQGMFPVYDNSLIPNGDPVATATALAAPGFMNCGPCGTSITDFSDGKKKWIEGKVPGVTAYSLDMNPNIDTLINDLTKKQDTELLLGFYDSMGVRVGGHFVTLFMASSGPDGTMLGFVDPFNPNNPNSALDVNKNYTALPGFLLVQNYGPVGDTTRVDFAIDESPIPEPGTLILLLSTMPLAGWLIRKLRR